MKQSIQCPLICCPLKTNSLPSDSKFRPGLSDVSFERVSARSTRVPLDSAWYKCTNLSGASLPLVGLLTTPKKEIKGDIILLGGSGGGVETELSDHFASKGFRSFAIAYHNGGFPVDISEYSDSFKRFIESSRVPLLLGGDLPSHLERINLELLGGAIGWFEREIVHLDRKVMLCGVSRGGELALILGSLHPDRFSKILALVPSNRVNGAYSWRHKVSPASPAWIFSDGSRYEGDGMPSFDPKIPPSMSMRGTIPVQDIESPILALSFQRDRLWRGLFMHRNWRVNTTLQACFDAKGILDPRKRSDDVAIVWEGKYHWCYPPGVTIGRWGSAPNLVKKMEKSWRQIHGFIEKP